MSPDHPHGYRVRAAAWSADADRRRRPWSNAFAAFATLAEAEADARARELAAWSVPGFDPFAFDAGCLFYLSSLPDEYLRDWLLDHGVDPPDRGETWSDWHRRTRPDPLLMRTALDKLRLFDVAERWPTAYLVAEPSGRWWLRESPQLEQLIGAPVAAYHTRATADARAAAFLADETRDVPNYEYIDEREFVCVVPVDARGRGFRGSGFLLSRGVAADPDDPGAVTTPLGVFPTPADATAAAGASAALGRKRLNPFAALGRVVTEAFMDALFLADVPVTYRQPWVQFNDNGAAWYDAEQAQLTDADRAVIWGQFTDPPLYTVTEVDFDGAAG